MRSGLSLRAALLVTATAAIVAVGCSPDREFTNPVGAGGQGGHGGQGGASSGSSSTSSGAGGDAECSTNSGCPTGACVHGVCCSSACDGPCMGCSTALTGEPNGTCAPLLAATDPFNECPASGVETCGENGLCDGAGKCGYYSDGTECSTPRCASGVLTLADTCVSGACQPSQQTEACPSGCDAARTGCASTCIDDASCEDGTFCASTGECTQTRPTGGSCSRDPECTSNHCVDDVCCNTACNTSCDACSAAVKMQGSDGICGKIAGCI